MKKILLLLGLSLGTVAFSQVSTLVINNYSIYTITGRLRATDLTNCVPEIYMGNTLASGNFTIPPTTTTDYPKYYTANTAPIPVNDFLVRLSYTSPATVLAYNDPNMYAISPTTDWSFFAFDVRDTASINTVYDHYDIGVAPCAASYPTNGIGTVSETEWFTITSGGTIFSYINIY